MRHRFVSDVNMLDTTPNGNIHNAWPKLVRVDNPLKELGSHRLKMGVTSAAERLNLAAANNPVSNELWALEKRGSPRTSVKSRRAGDSMKSANSPDGKFKNEARPGICSANT